MEAKLWHVAVDGTWLARWYAGYAPVSVLVGGVLKPVEFRHVADGCDREACVGVPSAEDAEVKHTCEPGIGYGCDVPDCVTGD